MSDMKDYVNAVMVPHYAKFVAEHRRSPNMGDCWTSCTVMLPKIHPSDDESREVLTWSAMQGFRHAFWTGKDWYDTKGCLIRPTHWQYFMGPNGEEE